MQLVIWFLVTLLSNEMKRNEWILLSVAGLLEMPQCKTFRKLQVGYKTITTFYSGFPL